MKWIAFACALMALVSGLWAAWRWYRSSQVQIDPGWGLPGQGLGIEPGDEAGKAIGWTVATMQAFNRAGELNRSAAFWSAISVAAGGISAVLGGWPLNA